VREGLPRQVPCSAGRSVHAEGMQNEPASRADPAALAWMRKAGTLELGVPRAPFPLFPGLFHETR
jgi:hypothetical protein